MLWHGGVTIEFFIAVLACFNQVAQCQGDLSAITTAPPLPDPTFTQYCGDCFVDAEYVRFSAWYSEIFTTYVATLVYQVDNGTGSTTSSLIYPNTTTSFISVATPFSDVIRTYDYVTLNTLTGVDQSLLYVQKNTWADFWVWLNTYTTLTNSGGSITSQCLSDEPLTQYWQHNITSTYSYTFTLTTVVNWHTQDYGHGFRPFIDTAFSTGSEVFMVPLMSQLGIDTRTMNCTAGFAGDGGMKIGVTALTSTTVVYVSNAPGSSSLISSTAPAPGSTQWSPPPPPPPSTVNTPATAGDTPVAPTVQPTAPAVTNGQSLPPPGNASPSPGSASPLPGNSPAPIPANSPNPGPISSPEILVDGHTISSIGAVTTLSPGVVISLGSSGAQVGIGTQVLTSGSAVVMSGTTYSLNSGGIVVGAGTSTKTIPLSTTYVTDTSQGRSSGTGTLSGSTLRPSPTVSSAKDDGRSLVVSMGWIMALWLGMLAL